MKAVGFHQANDGKGNNQCRYKQGIFTEETGKRQLNLCSNKAVGRVNWIIKNEFVFLNLTATRRVIAFL